MKKCFAVLVGGLAVLSAAAAGARAEQSYTRDQDIIYGRKYGTALTMDVFTPKQNVNGAAIVVCISGGWVSNHDNIQPVPVVIQIQDGKTVAVGPKEAAAAEFIYPLPGWK